MNTMPVAKPRSWSSTLLLLDRADPMDQIAVLDANLSHVQRDVTEIKNDQRRAADKLDDMNGRLDTIRDKIDGVGNDSNRRIDAVADKVGAVRSDLTAHLENLRKEISADVHDLRTDLSQKIETMRSELFSVKSSVSAAKVWTLGLQITIAASLLGVIAHGFKWL